MKKLAILIPALALILACSANVSMQPGQWEWAQKVTDIQIPGVPQADMARVKQARVAAEPNRFGRCLNAVDIESPTSGIIRNIGGLSFSCTFSKETFEGGRIDMAATCPTESGHREVTYTGTYTAGTMEMQISSQAHSLEGPGLRDTSLVSGRRTGDCVG